MRGSQEPHIKVEPPRAHTDGQDAAMLTAAYGNTLDPWQALVLDCWLGTNEQGEYNVASAGLSVPRQNGKNDILIAREFFGMVINGEKILHTAHQVKTSKKHFRRIERLFKDRRHPEIAGLVKQIRYTNGEECVELQNGGSIEFSARSRQAARGFDGISLLVYDEAQELTDDQVEALMPTLAASATGTRQILYTGTPPYPGCPGEVFRRIRLVTTTEPGKGEAWHEWGVQAKGIDEIAVEDTSLWYMTNPALGIRLTEDSIGKELRAMSKDGFARERLGWWSPAAEQKIDYAIDREAWEDCKSFTEKPEGKTAYGVKFSADGAEVVLCGAVCPKSGPARISIIDMRPTGHGIRWLSDWLNARYKEAACVVVDGRNGTEVLVERITTTWKAKESVIRPSAKDVVAAAGMLITAVNERAVTWYGPQEIMNESAMNAVKRPIGGGFGFGGEGSSVIEAAALALWGARTSKRDPTRKMRIG